MHSLCQRHSDPVSPLENARKIVYNNKVVTESRKIPCGTVPLQDDL